MPVRACGPGLPEQARPRPGRPGSRGGNRPVLAAGAGGRAPARGRRGACCPKLHSALPGLLDP